MININDNKMTVTKRPEVMTNNLDNIKDKYFYEIIAIIQKRETDQGRFKNEW